MGEILVPDRDSWPRKENGYELTENGVDRSSRDEALVGNLWKGRNDLDDSNPRCSMNKSPFIISDFFFSLHIWSWTFWLEPLVLPSDLFRTHLTRFDLPVAQEAAKSDHNISKDDPIHLFVWTDGITFQKLNTIIQKWNFCLSFLYFTTFWILWPRYLT